MNEWNRFISDMLSDWWQGVERSVDDLVSKVEEEARKEGLDPRYLFFILFKHSKTVHALPTDSRALSLAASILQGRAKSIPRFSGFTIPEPEEEDKVDEALTRVAIWTKQTWLEDQAARLVRLTKNRLSTAATLYEKMTSEVPSNNQRLMELVWRWMRKLCVTHWFMGPSMTSNGLLELFGVPMPR